MTRLLASTLLAILPLAGQTAKSWNPPRTLDGQPDLQGIWNNATLTPMERPAEFAAKPVLSEQEAAVYEKRLLKDVDADRRDGGGATDVNRAYNEFWRDRGKLDPNRRTSLIIDPPDGRIPPMTPQGKDRAATRAQHRKLHPADGPEDRSPSERCIAVTNAGPPMMPANYNANYQIVQTPGYVVILSEQIHDARVIPLDGRPHIPSNMHHWSGDSRGHWDGNTLVVETTNFTDQTNFQGTGVGLKLTERFTRSGPNTILYEFTVDDPATFTKSWTAQIPMNRAPGPLFEYACHEGNYGMEGTLSGFRAEEARSASK